MPRRKTLYSDSSALRGGGLILSLKNMLKNQLGVKIRGVGLFSLKGGVGRGRQGSQIATVPDTCYQHQRYNACTLEGKITFQTLFPEHP
jgi:hypothetical protein